MTYKGASLLVLFWGIFNLVIGGVAYYFMGSFAHSNLIIGVFTGILGFSIGHFLNRGRKQAFILALASCLLTVFVLGSQTSIAFNQEQITSYPDAMAAHPQNIALLVSSAMLTCTLLVLILLVIFAKPIYSSFRKEL